jgi:hypothetical protein
MTRRRYVLRGVPGGWRIWDNSARRFWGELYEVCPEELVDELNGKASVAAITRLTKQARSARR